MRLAMPRGCDYITCKAMEAYDLKIGPCCFKGLP
jgi:hypothetical protein